jgi:hypothetical protein
MFEAWEEETPELSGPFSTYTNRRYRLILPSGRLVKAQQGTKGRLGFVLSDPPRGHAMHTEISDVVVPSSCDEARDKPPAAFVQACKVQVRAQGGL